MTFRRIRISSSRTNYVRGGLTFSDATARRIGGGRLAIVLDRAEAEALGDVNRRELLTDPAIKIEACGADGFTAVERHANFRDRVRRQWATRMQAPAAPEVSSEADHGPEPKLEAAPPIAPAESVPSVVSAEAAVASAAASTPQPAKSRLAKPRATKAAPKSKAKRK